jgi:hypothetical protein
MIEGELVVAGGVDAQGALIPNAEIYDASTLAFVREEPVAPRSHATATVISNRSVVLIGGQVENARPSTTVEIYQPPKK